MSNRKVFLLKGRLQSCRNRDQRDQFIHCVKNSIQTSGFKIRRSPYFLTLGFIQGGVNTITVASNEYCRDITGLEGENVYGFRSQESVGLYCCDLVIRMHRYIERCEGL